MRWEQPDARLLHVLRRPSSSSQTPAPPPTPRQPTEGGGQPRTSHPSQAPKGRGGRPKRGLTATSESTTRQPGPAQPLKQQDALGLQGDAEGGRTAGPALTPFPRGAGLPWDGSVPCGAAKLWVNPFILAMSPLCRGCLGLRGGSRADGLSWELWETASASSAQSVLQDGQHLSCRPHLAENQPPPPVVLGCRSEVAASLSESISFSL